MTSDSSSDDFDPAMVLGALDDLKEQVRQTCYEEGLLKRGWLGNEFITKDGRDVVKAAALVYPEVAEDLQEALDTPVRKRMPKFVHVLLMARSRLGTE